MKEACLSSPNRTYSSRHPHRAAAAAAVAAAVSRQNLLWLSRPHRCTVLEHHHTVEIIFLFLVQTSSQTW